MALIDDQLVAYVQKAQDSDSQALEQLLLAAEPQIRAYIYRVTLNLDLTEDLSQETCLEIVRSINQCQQPEKFWPWVYRIAQSKISQHYRKKGRHQRALNRRTDQALVEKANQQTDTLGEVLHKEVIHGLMEAIGNLTGLHRAVLALRCFEQYSYADIATAIDCSEGKARITFFRAKQHLQANLRKRGLDAGIMGLGLTLLAQVTAPSTAQAGTVTVTTASLQTSATTALLARLSTPKALLSLAAGLLVFLGLWFASSQSSGLPQRQDIRSLHFTMQSQNPGNTSLSRGAYEQWYYYPEGVDGPLLARMQRWRPDLSQKLCAWMLNEEGHYYYNSGGPTVYRENSTWFWSNGDVRYFPYDEPNISTALGMDTNEGVLTFERDEQTQLLTHTFDSRFPDLGTLEDTFQYNQTERSFFTYPWPKETPVIDKRDTMHRRGWTYLEIQGTLCEQPVQGHAYIPFYYKTYQTHKPWLTITVGQDRIFTTQQKGSQYSQNGEIQQGPTKLLWSGLPRPWLGLHSVDLIRRDAAQQQLYNTHHFCFDSNYGEITIMQTQGYQTKSLRYGIDLDNDLIKTLDFIVNDQTVGHLSFRYLQEFDATEPQSPPKWSQHSPHSSLPDQGIQWLMELITL